MTENELDEMLDQWSVPPMRDSLRDRLRTEFVASPARTRREGLLRRAIAAAPRLRIGRLAIATVAAAAAFFALVQVSPRTVRMASSDFRIPFYVDFEYSEYTDDGSVSRRFRTSSFFYGGYEVAMSVTEAGNPFLDVFRGIGSSIRNRMVLAMPSLVTSKVRPLSEPAWFAGYVRSGCSEGRNVIGHETVAGYQTTVQESRLGSSGRMKLWMAPDLDCFTLKMTHEAAAPNGSYRLTLLKEGVKVTMNP